MPGLTCSQDFDQLNEGIFAIVRVTSMRRGFLPDLLQKLRRGYVQSTCDGDHVLEPNIPRTSLYIRKIGPVDPGPCRRFLL